MSDGAIAAIVSGAVTIATMLFAYLKLKYQAEQAKEEAKQAKVKAAQVEDKIDQNTAITKGGLVAAAKTAEDVKTALTATNEVAKKLNGGIDSAIESAVKPIRQAMADHAIQDEANMKEIRSALEDIRRRLK